jgi:hypothetical protein
MWPQLKTDKFLCREFSLDSSPTNDFVNHNHSKIDNFNAQDSFNGYTNLYNLIKLNIIRFLRHLKPVTCMQRPDTGQALSEIIEAQQRIPDAKHNKTVCILTNTTSL